ncbi:MAG: TRAP transporter small permease [Halopseudomonas sp.]
MKVLRWLDEHLEATLAAALLASIVIFIIAQIFMRYIAENPLSWTEEIILWAFVWFIWIGISYAFKERRHVKVTVFVDFLPDKLKMALEVIIDLLIITFFVILIWQSFKLITLPYVLSQTSVVLNLPIALLYASAPAGAVLSVYRITQNLCRNLLLIKSNI